MPELPEVETVVRSLRPKVLKGTINHVDLHRDDILTPRGFNFARQLAGRSIKDITRRGKRIVITLDDANRFYIHLGMTGRLTIEPHKHEIAKHTHLTLHFDEFQLRFRDPRRFGGVWWLGADETDDMGPEPLTFKTAELSRRLARTTRAIKNVLLDQSVIAGLGNIYVDESLFDAHIHPLIPANELTDEQVSQLNRSIKKTLRKALDHRGSTLRDYVDAEGGKGAFQNLHKVYDRADQPCRACKSKIVRIVLGGRSTCFCPKCQPA